MFKLDSVPSKRYRASLARPLQRSKVCWLKFSSKQMKKPNIDFIQEHLSYHEREAETL